MRKLKFKNPYKWNSRTFRTSRKEVFKYSLNDKHDAINKGWLYVFFWDTAIQEEFQE